MMEIHAGLELAMRPVQPGMYDGTPDFLTVNTWLYNTTEYFGLLQESSSTGTTKLQRIRYASRQLTDSAAVWWYTLMKTGRKIDRWEEFEQAVRREFIPGDHERRAWEKLWNICQKETVANCVNHFQNIALTVSDLHEKEK